MNVIQVILSSNLLLVMSVIVEKNGFFDRFEVMRHCRRLSTSDDDVIAAKSNSAKKVSSSGESVNVKAYL